MTAIARRAAALCTAALTIITVGCASRGVGLTYDERWVGYVAPLDRTACGAPTRGTLTRSGDGFSFAPNDGVLVINGTIGPDGQLRGTLALTGADHRPYALTLEGRFEQSGFRGVYRTPRCQFEVALHPP